MSADRLPCGCPTATSAETHGCELMCGCPVTVAVAHRPGCWMDAAETIVIRAVGAERIHPLVSVVAELAAAGHLREADDHDQLVGLLDYLTEVGLLGPAESGAAT